MSSKSCWAFIDLAPAFGGHEVMLLRWLTELQKQSRITPTLIARKDTRLYDLSPAGIDTLPLPGPAAGKSRLKDTYYLVRHLLRIRPAIAVVAEGCLLSQAWVTLLLRLLAIKTIVYVPLTQSGIEMGFNRGATRDWVMRNIYRHLPHAWITLTADQAQHFMTWSGVKRPVFTLPNAVAAEIEDAGMLAQPVHTPLRVLVLGRLDAHQKGLDSLLSFLSIHVELKNAVHFNLVGNGPYQAEVKRQLAIFPALQQLVTLHDWAQTLEVMRTHDVLLLASRYEGVPLVMLEAMALGMPVIATDLPGTRTLLAADCLYAVGDYHRAMQLLGRLSRDETRAAIVKRNHEIFMAHASGAAFSQAVESLTTELASLCRHRTSRRQSDNAAVAEA